MLTKINSRYYYWNSEEGNKYILDQDEKFRTLLFSCFHWNLKFRAFQIENQEYIDLNKKQGKYINFYILWGISMILSVILRKVFQNIFVDDLVFRLVYAVICFLLLFAVKIYISKKQKQELMSSLNSTNYKIKKLKMVYLSTSDAIKCNLRNLFGFIYLLSVPIIGILFIIFMNEILSLVLFLIAVSVYFILVNATIPGLKPGKETLNITFVEVQ